MQINRIDHLVTTVDEIERTVDFYQRVLAMQRIEFAAERIALRCGANGAIVSLYLCDPDGNLIELQLPE